MVFLVVFAVVIALVMGAVYVWTRRTERDVEIPARELTDAEKQQRTVAGTVVTAISGQGGAFS